MENEFQPDPDWEIRFVPSTRVEVVGGRIVLTPDKRPVRVPTEAYLRKLFKPHLTENEN